MSSRNNDLSRFDPLAAATAVPAVATRGDAAVPQQGVDGLRQQVQFLEQQGFSSGLIQTLVGSNYRNSFPQRVWILDNSAPMNVRDGNRITGTFDSIQRVPVTRWEELQDCVAYHSQMAAVLLLPTRFAFLNDPGAAAGPQYFGVAAVASASQASLDLQTVHHVMTHSTPTGPTFLTAQIYRLQQYVTDLAPHLRQLGQTVAVILATQGLPTSDADRQGVLSALRSLEGLPVWVVIRLCTDDESVSDFYNSLDVQLNLPYDVLDDFFGESLEVFLRNPWLTYALPLHRFREHGARSDVLDALDERPLSLQQVHELCTLLFVSPPLPDPARDWNSFMHAISNLVEREKLHWNPVTRKVSPWINLHDLNRLYGGQNSNAGPFQYAYSPQQPPHVSASTSQPQQPSPTWGQQGYYQHAQQSQQCPPPVKNYQRQAPPVLQNQSRGATGIAKDNLRNTILFHWALLPAPSSQANSRVRPLPDLLGTVQNTFPPSFGVEPHEYFSKWKPFAPDALLSGQVSVLKRGTLLSCAEMNTISFSTDATTLILCALSHFRWISRAENKVLSSS
jgi:hypothetical protein